MPPRRQPPRLVRVPDRPFWYVRDGREIYSTGTEDENQAATFLGEYLAEKSAPPKSPTIADILDARLADLKAAGKARASNTGVYHKQLKAHFGPLRPERITVAFVKQYWVRRAAVPASLREELLELRVAMGWAKKQGWIGPPPDIEVPAKHAPRERFLSRAEALRLLQAATMLHLRLFVLIAMTTGHRRGAILGLTWDRVNLEKGWIDFNDPDLPVTKKRRTVVPIGPEVVVALRDATAFAETPSVIEYMGKSVASVKRSFAEAATAAGIPWATPHILKHSVISWMAMAGFSVDKASDLTATHPSTVRRIYRKFDPEYLRDAAGALSAGLGLLGSSNPFDERSSSRTR